MSSINVEQQLESMVRQYQNLIYSVCFKMVGDYFDAQDLTQETFLSAYRSLAFFDGTNERAWLCKIATNKCLDYLKNTGRRQIPTEDNYFHLTAPPDMKEEILKKSRRLNVQIVAKSHYTSKKLELFCYTLKVSLASALAIIMLMFTPVSYQAAATPKILSIQTQRQFSFSLHRNASKITDKSNNFTHQLFQREVTPDDKQKK